MSQLRIPKWETPRWQKEDRGFEENSNKKETSLGIRALNPNATLLEGW